MFKNLKFKVIFDSNFSAITLSEFHGLFTKSILFYFLLFTFNFHINAQTEKDWVRNGDDLIANYKDYYGGSLWYKKALDNDSTVLETAYKYAEALRGYNDYANAESSISTYTKEIEEDFFL